MKQPAIIETHITHLPLVHRGKVRDIYAVDDEHLLIVATDRLSAFDVVLPTPIPGKGAILAHISNFWFEKTRAIIPNHCSELSLQSVLNDAKQFDTLKNHAVVVKKMHNLPVEAIMRGYIIGSGWKDYQRYGSISGVPLPAGLQQAEKLPQPIFTPSTKAAVGEHDENIAFEHVVAAVGHELAEQMKSVSTAIYEMAYAYAKARGILIADSKFEFGTDKAGNLVLIDEVLTPDSSRFWDMESYQVGISPPSFDKQIIRDYLETLDWDKTAPGPELPQAVIDNALARYQLVEKRLLG
ncbi:phosphoribosylaminoimidazolesuccinocarboxamide synthase [Ostreibacterium oceani]|uniref:Phosphoribosylaminoimidazole-succinocarboxamide synthase n=1 Tax=Ostreibacterium oceani TaxID=2654998 RepID=A0A6N7EZT2_9GAMM|nr:phosphoribosylaminoimidazolesuccinocarboxamide synthase [Ostreibacterium oceani]MPV86637.1 phosphoribosylaminoimidazolesuccinocarboxamide synthase [Ostreibacterium oceani]